MSRKTVRIFFYLLLSGALSLIIYQHNTAIVTFLLFLSLIVYIVLIPPAISENSTGKGQVFEPSMNAGAQALLVLSSGNDPSGDNVEEEWINILKKECGYFSTIRITDKFSFSQYNAKLILLTQEALKEISSLPALLINLELLAQNDGCTLFLESPDSSYEFLTGVVTGPEEYLNMEDIVICGKNVDINLFPPLNIMLPFRSVLTITDDSETNISSGNRCLMFSRKAGNGNIVSIFFTLSKWRRSITFGTHNSKEPSLRRLSAIGKMKHFQTADLSCVKNRTFEDKPFQDILERFIIQKCADISRIPIWWYYPYCAESSAILTFDEDYCGDELKAFLKDILPDKIKFTIFLMSSTPASEDTFELIKKRNGESGIHWNRFNFHITGSGFHYEKEKKLKDQFNNLSARLKKDLRLFSRIHYLLCDYNPFSTINALNDASVKADSSWGPARDMGGYIFGTGFPYHAPRQEGGINAVYEFPFQVHEPQGNLSKNDIIKLISGSSEKYHSPVVLLFHPHHCIGSGKTADKFLSIVNYIKEKAGLWTTSINGFIDFYEKRSNSAIICKTENCFLEIECNVREKGLSLNLPRPDDIIKMEVDDSLASSANISGRKIVNLEYGKHLIKVQYNYE